MVDTTVPFQVVVFTQVYTISGGVFLREQRFSDFLNDRRDTYIMMRNTKVSRLENPAKVIEQTPSSFIPKAGIVLAFEQPQKVFTSQRRVIKYPKQTYAVFLALDGMEIHGKLNQQGPMDLRGAITNASESFVPITQASVSFQSNPTFILKCEAVLVNVQRIRFIGDVVTPAPAEEIN